MFWSQHLRCWGQNTSRIQNKGVCATLCLQVLCKTTPRSWYGLLKFLLFLYRALCFKMACKQNLDLSCVLVCSTLGAGAKTRLHTPKAVAYHEQPHYCRFMIGHSLGRMESRMKKFTPYCMCRLQHGEKIAVSRAPTTLGAKVSFNITSSLSSTTPTITADVAFAPQGESQSLPPAPPCYPFPRGKRHTRGNIRGFTVG